MQQGKFDEAESLLQEALTKVCGINLHWLSRHLTVCFHLIYSLSYNNLGCHGFHISVHHNSYMQDSNNLETLVNLVVVSQHLGKPQEVSGTTLVWNWTHAGMGISSGLGASDIVRCFPIGQ